MNHSLPWSTEGGVAEYVARSAPFRIGAALLTGGSRDGVVGRFM